MYGAEKLKGDLNLLPIYLRHVHLANSEAWKSNFKYKMSCLLIKGGKLLSSGHNYIDSDPKVYFNCSLHAEVDAILNCRTVTKGAKALIYRFKRSDNTLASSAPCVRCQRYLLQADIKYAICVDENMNLIKARF